MNAFSIVCFCIWLYVLSVLYRGKLDFYRFIWGSVGTFVFLLIWLQPVTIIPLGRLVVMAAGVIGELTGLYQSNYQYSFMFIETANGAISLYINYECSGIIEIMAFVSMLMFFQVYTVGQRIIVGTIGCFWIFSSNVIRLVVICVMTHFGGAEVYYLAHTVVGRLVFYALTIILYYYVFTRSQIISQKVGGFEYDKHN